MIDVPMTDNQSVSWSFARLAFLKSSFSQGFLFAQFDVFWSTEKIDATLQHAYAHDYSIW